MPHPLWNTLAQKADLQLSPEQLALFDRYLDLPEEANLTMNLTRIVNRTHAEVAHIGDALTLLPFLPKAAHRLVDIGSGGGVPGIPLAIARRDVGVLLVESTQKKAAFLTRVATELKLENVSVSAWRAEEVGNSNSRESFDIVTARAVGELAFLVEWCMPLVKTGGKMLAMKGAKIHEELPRAGKALSLSGAGKPIIHPVELPDTSHHVIVEIVKTSTTHHRLPRTASDAKGKIL